jgi:hypothetical protein
LGAYCSSQKTLLTAGPVGLPKWLWVFHPQENIMFIVKIMLPRMRYYVNHLHKILVDKEKQGQAIYPSLF